MTSRVEALQVSLLCDAPRSWTVSFWRFLGLFSFPNGVAQTTGTMYLYGFQVSDYDTGYVPTSGTAFYDATLGSTYPNGIKTTGAMKAATGNFTGNAAAASATIGGDTTFSAAPRLTFGGYMSSVNATSSYVAYFLPTKAITITGLFATNSTGLTGCSPYPTVSVYDNSASSTLVSASWSTGNTLADYPISVSVAASHVLLLQTTAGTSCSGGGSGNITVEYVMQ